MSQYAAYNPTTMEVAGLLENASDILPGGLYTYGLVDPPLPAYPTPPHSLAVLVYVEGEDRVEWRDDRTLAQAKTERLEAMRAARDAAINSPFTWDGSSFDANETAQTRLTGLRVSVLIGGFTSRAWRLADNTWRTLSATDAAGVWDALQNHIQVAFSAFAALEAAIASATTNAAVDAEVWT